MSIYGLLQKSTFDPQAAKAGAAAYENILLDLKLINRRDPLTDLIAERVFQVAQCGERDPSKLRQQIAAQLTTDNQERVRCVRFK